MSKNEISHYEEHYPGDDKNLQSNEGFYPPVVAPGSGETATKHGAATREVANVSCPRLEP